jgi:integrase
MPLNHSKLQAIKPADKPYKVGDQHGLYLSILPTGSMTWRYQYYLNGKREAVTIGVYRKAGAAEKRVETSLDEARDRLHEYRRLVANGQSPAKLKQAEKARAKIEAAQSSTVEELSERWLAEEVSFKSEAWQYNVKNWLNLDVLPAIGKLDPRRVSEDDIATLVGKIASRGSPSSANKVRMICMKLFQYAIDKRELKENPTKTIKAINTPNSKSHRALSVKEIGPFLVALDAIGAKELNKIAIKLMLLTLTRKDELRLAKWDEFDLENGIWNIPAHRMKMRESHQVYLSRQVIELMSELKPLSHGSEFLFPNNSSLARPIGHTTINGIIDRLEIGGARFVPHGFRATASSILNEAHFRHDVIEKQLAHKDSNRVRAVYNQAYYADERRQMLQWWADYVDSLKQGSNVIPLNARRVVAVIAA